ncbi:MAG TPA: phospholipase D-like domain-containing protein [Candidatus Tumulicola sp.]|jgi:phosphatidylserine/phosphatidylglycerophosphate/cardiolipin synthase-like enzyme
MVRLSSDTAALRAVRNGRDVTMVGYTLQSRTLLHALEDAARRGARVRVRLDGAPYGDPDGSFANYNRRLVSDLRAAGADAAVTREPPDAPLHAKALAVDDTLYLDDRNWASGDLILRDGDPCDAAAIRAIAGGRPASVRPGFALQKREALQLEARMLDSARAGDSVTVETETFGSSNSVCRALDDIAKRGVRPHLLVQRRPAATNVREQRVLERLAADGVEIRMTSDSEKFATCAGAAWIGSANASPAFGQPDLIDWGTCTRNRAVVNAVETRLAERWNQARPFAPKAPAKNVG